LLRPGGHGGCGCLAAQRGERCRDGDGRVSQAQERGSGGVDGDVVQGELGDAEGRLGEQQDRPVHGVGMASRPLPESTGCGRTSTVKARPTDARRSVSGCLIL